MRAGFDYPLMQDQTFAAELPALKTGKRRVSIKNTCFLILSPLPAGAAA